jgi:hypothetical protein
MNDPYENQYIGAFVYALGFRAGSNSETKEINAAIDLLQQTPGDAAFGDLVYNENDHGIIIEFKRNWEATNAEREKESKGEFHSSICSHSNMHIGDLSRACHYIAYGYIHEGDYKSDILFTNYLDWLQKCSGSEIFGLDAFVGRVLSK